jgi:hypothetical protein
MPDRSNRLAAHRASREPYQSHDHEGTDSRLIPIGEQQVRLRLPDGTRAKEVRLLTADRTPRAEYSGTYLNVWVPSILDHEVVAIDL